MSLQHCTSCGNRYEHSHEHRKDCVFYGPSAEGEKLRSGDYGLTGSSPLAAGPADAPTPEQPCPYCQASALREGEWRAKAEDLRRQLAGEPDSRIAAWYAVWNLLNRLAPNFYLGPETGETSALEAIASAFERAEAAEADARELWEALDRNTVGLERIREKHRAKYGREG